MRTLVFLLEEPSARELLAGVLPRILPEAISVKFLVFEGKQDLELRMVGRMRRWLLPNSKFIVLRDQDANPDCKSIKARLRSLADQAQQSDALIRVACRELESWVLGDLGAVGMAFQKADLEKHQQKAQYRDPDKLSNPIDEIRKFVPGYQKMEGARRLGNLLNPDSNRSISFLRFCEGVRRLALEP